MDQFGNVLGPLAQGRQTQGHHIQAVEQILAEQALADQPAEIAVGRSDDPDIGLDRRAAADGHILALLEDAQKTGLGLERHIADLVEEQCAAFGLLEPAGSLAVGAREGALFVAEQLAFDQLARDRRHVDRHERAVAAAAEIMKRAGDKLLAGAGLAVDHDRQIGLHQPGERAIDLLHRRRAADQRQSPLHLRPGSVDCGMIGVLLR